MAFRLKRGKTVTRRYPVKTSTAISAGGLVIWASGKVTLAISTSAKELFAGVLVKEITSSDGDYADARSVAVQVPLNNSAVWTADVSASLVAADIGLYMDLTDHLNVTRASSTEDIVQCVRVHSATSGDFILNFVGVAAA